MLRRMMMAVGSAPGPVPVGEWTPEDLPDMPLVWTDETTNISDSRYWGSRGALPDLAISADPGAVINPSGMNGMRTYTGRFTLHSPGNTGNPSALLAGASRPWVAVVCTPDATQSGAVRRLLATYHYGTSFRFSLFSALSASTTTMKPYLALQAAPEDTDATIAAPETPIAPYALIGAADLTNGSGFISHNGNVTSSSSLSFSDAELSTTPGSYPPYVGQAYLPIPAYSGQYEDGNYAEILIGDGPLGETDRQKLEGYLAHKWGLVSALPAGHPYKLTPP